MVAVKDYLTRESTLLSFKHGDIIKLMDPEMNLERGECTEVYFMYFFCVSWFVHLLAFHPLAGLSGGDGEYFKLLCVSMVIM